MPINYEDLGRRVKQRREAAGMSQIDLAGHAELSTQHISNIENAKTKVSLEKLVDIANVLQASVDELICGSLTQAKVIYYNEVAGEIENMTNAELKALPEFLRSFSYLRKLLENKLKEDN